MDESNIKIAIKNMNVWLDECHNDSDTVVMTANVLRSIRDNYCELLRYRDAIDRLQKENEFHRKTITDNAQRALEVTIEEVEKAKSEAIKEFAEMFFNYLDVGHLRPPTEKCFSELDVKNMLDNLVKKMDESNKLQQEI